MRSALSSLFITLQSHAVRLISSSTVTCKTHYAAAKPYSDFKTRTRSKPISFTETDDGKKREEEGEAPRIELHKSRGQHILTDPRVLKSIVDKAGVRETDTVLEIGPGTGNLTLELLQAARRVIAVEIDPRMIEAVHKRIQGTEMAQRLELVRGDILRTELPSFDICVANIPYKISSPLIFKLLSNRPKFRNATLMLQKEFGRRLVAKPGDSLFNRLAVNVDLLAGAKLLMDVSKRHFTPCPKVDSSVVRIEPRVWPPPVDLNEWNRFTLMCFTRKNKTLGAIFRQKKTVFSLMKKADLWHKKQKLEGGNLEKIVSDLSLLCEVDDDTTDTEDLDAESDTDNEKFVCFKEKIVNILKSGGYEDKRSSKLSVEEFLRLISLYNNEGIHFS